ncbi:MAG: DUF2130 domain-containing protein [Candidatus Omnitrophica bacterium]|nr:DUF2130 domain-containing protein [Candidatus Omnitrophota bacterium]
MANELIKCPACGAEFELSQAIARDMETAFSKKYQAQMKEFEEKARREMKEQMETAQKKFSEDARKKAEAALKGEIDELKVELDSKTKRLDESRREEIALRKRQRELEEKEKALELETARRIDAERKKIQEDTLKNSEERYRLKDAEKDKQLSDMKKQIDELKRKAEIASQQNQGEVLELELEAMLKDEFQFDDIEPVGKGQKGGDIIQTVKTQSGRVCGKILWETKRTKAWSDTWIQKLKDDQRDTKADIAVLVSESLPKGMSQFRVIDGVWVAALSSSLSLALALRVVLTQVARERQLETGKKEKMELVYNYLTGVEFRNRVEAIVESFLAMKHGLDRERTAMNKIWDKREKQIQRVLLNIGGMQGDIEGLSGMTLPRIDALELPEGDTEAEENDVVS